MKIYKHRMFCRWAKAEEINDKALSKAVSEVNDGLVDGDFGSGLFKKRVPIAGKGKRGGYRTLLAFKQDDKAIFVYGYKKNELDNIDPHEKKVFKRLAKDLLALKPKQLQTMLDESILFEVSEDEK